MNALTLGEGGEYFRAESNATGERDGYFKAGPMPLERGYFRAESMLLRKRGYYSIAVCVSWVGGCILGQKLCSWEEEVRVRR